MIILYKKSAQDVVAHELEPAVDWSSWVSFAQVAFGDAIGATVTASIYDFAVVRDHE